MRSEFRNYEGSQNKLIRSNYKHVTNYRHGRLDKCSDMEIEPCLFCWIEKKFRCDMICIFRKVEKARKGVGRLPNGEKWKTTPFIVVQRKSLLAIPYRPRMLERTCEGIFAPKAIFGSKSLIGGIVRRGRKNLQSTRIDLLFSRHFSSIYNPRSQRSESTVHQ